jgi:hypothetical protein
MIDQQKKNRLLILIIFGLSIIPFLIAWGLKENPGLVKGKTNHGQLISPLITTERSEFNGFDTFSLQNINELPGHWLIVNVIPSDHCNEKCLDALLKTRQLRLMLNKELPRTRRVAMLFKNPATETANQWWLKDALLGRLHQKENKEDEQLFSKLLQEENRLDDVLVAKLIGNEKKAFVMNSDLIRIVPNDRVQKKLTDLRKGDLPDGMLFLMDPLGNLMMQYEPGFDPYQVKSDLMHLLRISQIG